MAASIANSSAVQIEASSLMRQLNSWSSQTKDIAVLLSSFDPSVYTFRCLGNLQNSSSNMLWKTMGQVSPFLRSERLKSILGCWRSQGGHSGGSTTLITSSSTSMSSRWGWSLIPKEGIVWLVIKQSLVLWVDNTRVCGVLRICFHFHIVLQAQLQPASL